MINIIKKYHFYAAHRNELIDDKCKHLHGHTYKLEVTIQFEGADKHDGVTMLFSDIDKFIDPIIKRFDHSTLIHEKDPLLTYLQQYERDFEQSLNLHALPYPTSAENLATTLLAIIRKTGLNAVQILLAETESSTVQILSFK